MTLGSLTEAIMLKPGTLDNKVTGTVDGSQAMREVKAVATCMLGHSQCERHLLIHLLDPNMFRELCTYLRNI
jgi:hypothetical protein